MEFNAPTDHYNIAANCGCFLALQGLSIFGRWSGRLAAQQQRELFGTYLGKGLLTIDGQNDTVSHSVTVCFGTDYDTQRYSVKDLVLNPGRMPHQGIGAVREAQ